MMRRFLVAVFAVLCLARPALATLGGKPSAFTSHLQLRADSRVAYTIQDWTDATSHSSIREYVAGGVVFAITWQGQRAPDWREMLGAYAPLVSDSRAAVSRRVGRRAGFAVRRAEIVFEQTGSLRAVRGRAFLPSRLPGGVSEREIHD